VRRGLGRGRSLIGIGAVIAIIGIPLPWLKVGGVVLSAKTANGLQGTGVLVFVAAVGMLALIVLPFAMKSGRSSLDRPVAYLSLLVMGLVGLIMAAIDVLGTKGASASLTDVPGVWIGGVGMILAAWGVAELFAARDQER
jgi:quinol-cytochrome oxidoreductase complex cytochrome b subunit